jgi:hypothetical protein
MNKSADVWIDLLLGIALLCAFVTLLLFNWLFSGPSAYERTHSSSKSIVPYPQHNKLVASNQENHSAEIDVEKYATKKNRERYREFLAIGCDASIILFWISFSR